MEKKRSSLKSTTLTKTELPAHLRGLPKTRHGHPFAPRRVPPGFHTIIDSETHPSQPWRDLPQLTGLPPFRMSLDSILDPDTIKSIKDNQQLVFHSVGDTGGVNTPTYIKAVSRFMECDLTYSKPQDRPSLFYHLGEVVYYDGESANYWPEFYEPYLNYHAPHLKIADGTSAASSEC